MTMHQAPHPSLGESDDGLEMRHLHSVQLLDEDECEDWVLLVMLHKRQWQKRHSQVPFYTLGMAAYLDFQIANGQIAYRRQDLLAANNQVLAQHFSGLLALVCGALQQCLGLPVSLAQDAALPGFHIYLPHPAFAYPVAKAHQDLQYRDVFPQLHPADGDLLSFTLSLSTPQGSGLDLWPDDADTPVFYPYRSGELVWHNGLSMHRAVLHCSEGLERVTLQGHGLRRNGGISLYW